MHIGFFSDGYVPQLNGVATSIDSLATVLEAQSEKVSIFAPKMGNYVDRRPRVYRFPSILAVKDPPLWLGTPISTRVFTEIPRLGLELVHTHDPASMHFIGWQVARREHLPFITTYHTILAMHTRTVEVFGRNILSAHFAEWWSRWTSNMCDHVIAPSEKIKALVESYGVRVPVTVIYNGIRIEQFQNRPRGFLRARLGLRTDAKILLTVGRLTPEKNVEFLVDVLARVVPRDPNIYLVHIGQGPWRSEYEEQAAKLGVGQNLRFAGPLMPDEMPNAYADADVYVTASLSEAHSLAALEGAATGLPLVVTRDQSMELIVADGENGFVVPLDRDMFAARVMEIFEHAELRTRMCVRSKEIASQYSVQAQARKLVQLYRDVIEQKKRAHS
jgi:glycosyltransferase involved in cell wall biosynthesis